MMLFMNTRVLVVNSSLKKTEDKRWHQ